MRLTPEERATILAALRFYQQRGLGDPACRPSDIHDLATANDDLVSLDTVEVESLYNRIEREDTQVATRLTKRDRLLRQVQHQREWIAQCGGDLAGYIAKYGSKDDPEHYGDGGEAIYKADTDALARMEKELTR